MYCLRQTALGAQTKSDRPSSPTQTHCKHSHLELQIQLEEWIHLPVLLDKMLYKVQYTFNTLFCTSLFLSGFAYIFMLFSEKITSACKKLNKESEHKNFFFLYIYIYTHTHIPGLVMSYSYKCKWPFAKTKKYRNIGNKLQNKKIINASFPNNRNIYRGLPTHPLEKKKERKLACVWRAVTLQNQHEHKSRVLVSSHTKTLMGTSLENIQINGHDRQRLLTSAFHLDKNEAPFWISTAFLDQTWQVRAKEWV